MSLQRAFIAIELPVLVQDAIQNQTDSLRDALDSSLVRWVASHNVHLTLKFLGDVSPANIELLKQMLKREADQHPPFEMRISGIGSFPTSRRPRVIWVGFNAPAILESLQRGIESAAARLGYEAEERAFSPHLTIGRVRQNLPSTGLQRIRAALEETTVSDLGIIKIDSVHLYKSDLQPAGPIYTNLFTASLNKI
jgi:RNA 2',3'-cyclic 3'-phosphodiesterase